MSLKSCEVVRVYLLVKDNFYCVTDKKCNNKKHRNCQLLLMLLLLASLDAIEVMFVTDSLTDR